MVRLRVVHSLGILPCKITEKAECGEDDGHEPELRQGEEMRDEPVILSGETAGNIRGGVGVCWKECHPDEKRARNCDDGIFVPDVGDEGGLAQDSCKNSGIQSCSPNPVACDGAVLRR